LDPRSTLYKPSNVLGQPSLIDVSECSSPDGTRGEAAVELHDDSPSTVQRDRTELVSDASQYVAEEGMVRDHSLSADSLNTQLSDPSLDDESGDHTSISPLSQPTASSQSSTSESQFEQLEDASLTKLPDGTFKCPKCPRTYPERRKAM